jgi:hypothetical protein
MPSLAGHIILIVGFNETNQTICYNDPASPLWGKPSDGYYNWMDVTDFKKAVRKADLPYLISTFENTSNSPLSCEERFEKVHKRNIEKLKGNSSAYGLSEYEEFFSDLWDDIKFGVNASKTLKKDFDKGIQNRFKTILIYKLKGIKGIRSLIMNRLAPRLCNVLIIPEILLELIGNSLKMTKIEKRYTAEYLKENIDINDFIETEAILFEQEAENWSKLASYHSQFKKRGVFMSFPLALILINKMADVLDNIIAIEEKIINNSI